MSADQVESTTTDTSPVVFDYVERNVTLGDKVTALIRERIIDGDLRPGDRLPSERDLGDQFGVSRTVVREAIRSLTAKGMVEPSSRGYHVSRVSAGTVSESMMLYLHEQPISYEQIHEIRTTIELEVTRLAAERATDEDIAAMFAQCDAMKNAPDRSAAALADLEFHRTVAGAAHNVMFVVMLDSIKDILLDLRRVTHAVPGRVEKGVRAHRRIAQRIADADAEGAVQAMSDHLNESLRVWKKMQRETEQR